MRPPWRLPISASNRSRNFKGGDKAGDQVTPIAGDKQREALTFLVGEILSDKSFLFSPSLAASFDDRALVSLGQRFGRNARLQRE